MTRHNARNDGTKRMTRLQTLRAKTAREFRRFRDNESGATAIEYAMIAVGVSIVIVAAVTAIGTSVKDSFTSAQAGLK